MIADQPLFITTAAGGRDAEAVNLLNELFLRAAEDSYSDLHFDEGEHEGYIKARFGLGLIKLKTVNKDLFKTLTLQIRAKSKLELADRRTPLDGRFKLWYASKDISIDVRVSVVPSINGESIVCRVLDQRNAARDINTILMPHLTREAIKEVIKEPNGLFLVTGPTGSGKTSTLYSILNELNRPDVQILTIEDPVEYRLPGIRQINIEQNNTFPQALRASLRQDPDIILVGEIRDAETAAIAVSAAVTGHLVLSTLHTNDAASTITRLIDLGVDPYTLGSALRGVLAQRLVRKLNEFYISREPTTTERVWMKGQGIQDVDELVSDVNSEAGDGFSGKLPIMELIVVDQLVRQAMLRKDLRLVVQAARKQAQYQTLSQAGIDLCRQGLTTLAEVRSIASSFDAGQSGRRIGEMLVEAGELSLFQLDIALEMQIKMREQGEHRLLGEILVDHKFCSQESVNNAIAMQ